ncbi:MAG: SUF system NifU family Fe-S cluster assembly protein [Spartobacteria bacterium]|nr:SUF system NifU family Fe-S cluster assembly protein [Spartobacteria bacterium]
MTQQSAREIIMQHYRNPHGLCPVADPAMTISVENTSCGDMYRMQLHMEGGTITDMTFCGHGCSISLASFSLMHDWLIGRNISDATEHIATLLTALPTSTELDPSVWGDITALTSVRRHRSRIRCALMCWQAAQNELESNGQ